MLRVKTNEKGEIEKYEARAVAKGFTQVEGIDYDMTFSPTYLKHTVDGGIGDIEGHGNASNGCDYGISLRTAGRGGPHGAARGDCEKGGGREDDAIAEVLVWAQVVPAAM